jgi:hypothetical protein
MFRPFGVIFRGLTIKGTCFTNTIDLSIILSYTDINYKIRYNCRYLNIFSKTVSCFMLYLFIDAFFLCLLNSECNIII